MPSAWREADGRCREYGRAAWPGSFSLPVHYAFALYLVRIRACSDWFGVMSLAQGCLAQSYSSCVGVRSQGYKDDTTWYMYVLYVVYKCMCAFPTLTLEAIMYICLCVGEQMIARQCTYTNVSRLGGWRVTKPDLSHEFIRRWRFR